MQLRKAVYLGAQGCLLHAQGCLSRRSRLFQQTAASAQVLMEEGGVEVAHPTGFEPVIPGFVDQCLIQFGHGCVGAGLSARLSVISSFALLF